MDRKEFKLKLINYISNNQQIISGFVALLATVIIASVLFANTSVGVVDYGEYTQTLYDMGLSYTDEVLADGESLYFTRVIEEYKITEIKILQILQLEGSQSLIYPVTAIGILCKLLGIHFSTKYLAILFSIITIFCIYSITRIAYYYLKEKAAAVGILCCFVLLCGNYIIYFNSLYRNGIYYVSILSFITILLHIVAKRGEGQYKTVPLLLFVSLLLLNAKETTIVYLPIVGLANIWAIFYCKPRKEKRNYYFLLTGLLLVFVVRSNILYTMENKVLFSDAQMYHSFFTGVLTESDNQEELLTELGLDISLKDDIGKNIYLSPEEYVLSPNSQEAVTEIYPYLNYKKLLGLYFKHPHLYGKVLETTAQNVKEIDPSKFLYINKEESHKQGVERFVWWQWIRNVIIPDSLLGYTVIMGISFLSLVFLSIKYRKDKEKDSFFFLCFILWGLVITQFATIFGWQGYADKTANAYYFILPFDLLLIVQVGFILKLWEVCRQPKLEEEEVLFLTNPIRRVCRTALANGKKWFQKTMLDIPNRAAFLCLVVSIVVVFGVLFFPKRIGAYNNGDFGRMMTAMNIQYTEEDWENVDELSLTKVVEIYDWEENYDYSKIMPYNPDLSQIWFSVPLKIIDNIVGLQFSTVYVTIMYAVLIVISMFFIMQVLFRRFGRTCLWFAIALIIVLLDQVNLGWLNSLFGEGIAFVSLLMVIASMLKIADMERRSCRWSFLFLFFSVIIFIGAKAQFTITTPILLLGALILFIYHRPLSVKKGLIYFALFLFGSIWVSVSAIGVYKVNENISSPDTTYQAIFYGLLMIVDHPEKTLEELGLDPRMAVDTGKHAYLDKSEYYCAPRTEQAEEMLYSKISTIDLLFYYLKHPKLLYTMMENSAQAAAKDMPNFILNVGEKTTEPHEIVKKFDIWGSVRSYVVCNHFWQLFLIYFLEIILIVRFIKNKNNSEKDKLFILVLLMVSAIGVLQYPLTSIGNGFADNTKQLYLFRITFDITVFTGIYLLLPYIKVYINKFEKRLGRLHHES